MSSLTTLHLFCHVVDNYGDIGICWRFSTQLQREHGIAVTLWVDDLASFRRLCPAVDVHAELQDVEGIAIRRWNRAEGAYADAFSPADVADIVIEFFAVDIPEPYIAAMAKREPRPVWLNFEGLSAEEWVEGCHTLPSSHPRLPLTKYFYFPGFTHKTGGLLHEADLEEKRLQFQSDSVAKATFLTQLGLTSAEQDASKVSLFCYPNAPVAELFAAWEQSATPVICLVPEGVAVDAVRAFLEGEAKPGAVGSKGALTVCVLPFLPQADYDKLLWACDFNFVRGEDSFVRAQWAGKPFIWHIYVQDEDLHHKKLRAFLDRYAIGIDSLNALSLQWNGAQGQSEDCARSWQGFAADARIIEERAEEWRQKVLEIGDMTSNLLSFCAAKQSTNAENPI
jgi:uncharacterized repeat protein (TIGR03837 family)